MKEEKKNYSDSFHASSGIAQKMRDEGPQLDLKENETNIYRQIAWQGPYSFAQESYFVFKWLKAKETLNNLYRIMLKVVSGLLSAWP